MYGMTTYPPSTGGTIHGYQLVNQLAARGHDILTCFYDHGEHPGITALRGRDLGRFLRLIDVLYIRAEWQTVSVELSLLKWLRWRRLPVVWEFNGTPNELLHQGTTHQAIARMNRRLRRWALWCDAAIAVTDDVAHYLRNELSIANVRVIPNGSDPAMFAPRQSREHHPHDPLNVVWIGTSSAGWHDLPTLLQAAERMHADGANVIFSIYGDPRSLPKSLPANVRLAGVVPYADLGSRLSDGDVGIHLFRHDPTMPTVLGSPLKLFDYMASGLAVITNCEGQQSDIIAAWKSGVKCDGSVQDLARHIGLLERDRALCRELGQNGRRAVVQRFNWEQVAAQTEDLLLTLRSATRPSPVGQGSAVE